MRTGRLLAGEGALEACYHCVTRVVERRFAFGAREKEKFVEMLRAYEEFCGVQVLTFCVMSNHVHVLVHVPKPPERMPDDAELVRLVRRAELSYPASELERQLAEMRGAGDDAGAERLRARFLRRMWNLASFMQSLKQRFSQWFNGRNERVGTLWEGRFKSVLVEGTGQTLSTMSAYIDLNPVRAGIVKDPADYRWSGYAEAVAGMRLARLGLKKVVVGVLESERPGETAGQQMRRLLARYRVYLFGNGEEREAGPDGTGARRGIGAREVEAVIRSGGKLSFYESMRCRVRYFSDGCAIGAVDFVEGVFTKNRDRFGRRRNNGAREMRNVDFGGLCTVRDLRNQAVRPAGASNG
jgi:REP element-mobilizing transposase RayT